MTHRIFKTPVASVYPLYLAKLERKGRTRAELDAVIAWLTGYEEAGLQAALDRGTDFETFFAQAPNLNPARAAITGKVCGVQVDALEPGTMREVRYLDKLVDELAKGRKLEKVLRAG